MILDLETFSLRDNESVEIMEQRPTGCRYIAVMARSVEMPEGPRSPVRHSDGAPVEQAAILAAEFGAKEQAWHWLQISPPSKELIGDLLFDSDAERDRWYYLAITDLTGRDA